MKYFSISISRYFSAFILVMLFNSANAQYVSNYNSEEKSVRSIDGTKEIFTKGGLYGVRRIWGKSVYIYPVMEKIEKESSNTATLICTYKKQEYYITINEDNSLTYLSHCPYCRGTGTTSITNSGGEISKTRTFNSDTKDYYTGESSTSKITYNTVTTIKPSTEEIKCKACNGTGDIHRGTFYWDGSGYGSVKPALISAPEKAVTSSNTFTKYNEGVSVTVRNGKYGYADAYEKIILPLIYDYASQFSEGLAYVALNGKGYYIDITGKQILSLPFEDAGTFHGGMAYVLLKHKRGFINKKGKVIVAPKYDDASNFSDGMAAVVLNGKEGFINETGKLVIPLKYTVGHSAGVSYFHDGLACLELNKLMGYIDRTGKVIVPFKYKSASDFEGGSAKVEGQEGWGCINIKGEEIVPAIYSQVMFSETGSIMATKDSKYFFYDKTGKLLYQ